MVSDTHLEIIGISSILGRINHLAPNLRRVWGFSLALGNSSYSDRSPPINRLARDASWRINRTGTVEGRCRQKKRYRRAPLKDQSQIKN